MASPETRPFGLPLSDPPAPELHRPHPRVPQGRPVTFTVTAIAEDGSYTYRSFAVWLAPSPSHQVPRRGRHAA